MISIKKYIQCPYCGSKFKIPRPMNQLADPREIECVPYTRDVGRFDPDGETDWFNPRKWTRIGKDYLPLLNWEKFGVLRVSSPDILIQYRVQACPHCTSLFDIYANYTENMPFEEIWPHLFARDSENRKYIKPYYGESLPIRVIRKTGGVFRSVFMGGVVFGFLLFLIWFLLHVRLIGFHVDNAELILHGVASVTIAVLLIVNERYVRYLESTKDFYNLFSIKNPKFGLVHWRNYILCRFVGVQNDKSLNLSQVDIISGGCSILLLLTAWIVEDASNIVGFALIVTLVIVIYVALSIIVNTQRNYRSALLRWVLRFLVVIVSVAVIVFVSSGLNIDNRIGSSVVDVVYWIVFAYFVGVSGLLSLSTSHYILDGATRIPMNLTPYNNFYQVKPLRILESFSIGLLLILFVSSLSIIYVSALANLFWLINWLRLVLVFLFVASGFALKRGEYFGIALVYLVLSFLPKFNFTVSAIPLDPSLIVLGVLFTFIVGFQITKTDGTIAQLLSIAKDKELDSIDYQIRKTNTQINVINTNLAKFPVLDTENIALQSQRASALESVEVLLRLRDRVDKTPVRPFQLRRVSELFVPVFSSFVMPIFLDVATKFLPNILRIP